MLGLSKTVVSPNRAGTDSLVRDYNFVRDEELHQDITFSRASGATQVGSDGFIKYAPNNLLPRSNEFTHTDWDSYARMTAGAAVSPTGETNASEITNSSGSIYDSLGGTLSDLCISIYAKKNTCDFLILSGGNPTGLSATFDLTDGTVSQTVGASNPKISDEGNGWYRCSVGVSTGNYIQFSARETGTSTGTRTTGIYVYGAQVERTFDLTAGPQAYKATDGADTLQGPRFDYDKDGNSKGLLIEEARTNLILRSEDMSHAYWNKSNCTAQTSGETDPAGTTSAYLLREADDSGQSHGITPTDNITFTGDTKYTISCYAKAAGRNFLRMTLGGGAFDGNTRAWFNLETGQVATTKAEVNSARITDMGNGWYRCEATCTSKTSPSTTQANYYIANADDTDSYDGDGVSGIVIWGCTVEKGAFSTSYIKTTGASATRSADDVKVDGTNFSRFHREGTGGAWILEAQDLAENRTASNKNVAMHVYESGSADLSLGQRSGGGTENRLAVYYRDGGDLFFEHSNSNLSDSDKNARYKMGVTFTTNDGAVVTNGKTVITDTSIPNIYSPTELRLGKNSGGGIPFCGHIARLRYYNKRISNTKLQKLTETKLLNKFPHCKAAHSLRQLKEGADSTPVARVRRDYDSYEADYTANDISSGKLSDDHTSSKQTTLPLDVSCDSVEMVDGGGTFTEIVTNGSMEADSHWAQFGSPDTEERSTTQKHSGTYSWYIDASAYRKGIQSSQWVATAGEKYTVSAWIYATEGTEILSGINNTTETIFGGHTVTADQWTHITYVTNVTTTGSTYVGFFTSSSTQNFYVDDVSVVEGAWVPDAGGHWNIKDGLLNRTAAGAQFCYVSEMAVEVGKTYDVSLDIVNHSTGTNYITFGGHYITKTQSANGHYTYRLTATSTQKLGFYAGTNAVYSIDNISVKEVSPLATGFSTRKINSSYTGKAMRCRGQDGTEVEVGFDDNDEISLLSPITNTSQNLLAYSEDFSSWSSDNTIFEKSTVTDPFGGTNAWKLTANSNTNSGPYIAGLGTANTWMTLSVYVKAVGATRTRIGWWRSSNSNWVNVETNWSAGGTPTTHATANSSNVNYEAIGTDGWYRVSLTGQAASASGQTSVNLDIDSESGNRSVIYYGAMLEETQYESTPSGAELITNGTFATDSDWTKGTGWTIADGVATHASGTSSGLDQAIDFVPNKTYDITYDVVSCSGGSGSIQARGGGSTVSQTIDSSSTGSNTFRYTDTEDHPTLRFSAGSGTTLSVDNVSVKEVAITSPSNYSQTPAISDDDSSTTATTLGEFAGNENLVAQSEDFSNDSLWQKQNCTQSAGAGTDPNGEPYATKLIPTSTTNAGLVRQLGSTMENASYTWSAYVKKGLSDWAYLAAYAGSTWCQVHFNLVTGEVGTASNFTNNTITSVGDGWYRISGDVTLTGTSDYLYILQSNTNNSSTITADGDKGLLVWGVQLNTNSLKTYQKTTSSTLTGDVNVVNWYDQNGGEDFNQATAADQPKIVIASALVTDSGGKASVSFDSSDLLNNKSLSGQSRLDAYFVTDITDTDYLLFADDTGASRYAYLSEDGDTANPAMHSSYGTPNVYVNGTAVSGTTRNDFHDASTGHSLITTDNATTATWGDAYIGTRVSGRAFTGKISEMVFFPNMDSSPKRFPIEQNQMNHFGVTLAQAHFEADASAFGASNALGSTATITHETTAPLTGSGSMKVTISGNAGSTSYPRLYGNNVGVDNLFLPADPVIGEKYKITMTTKLISGEVEMIGIGFGDQGGDGSNGEVSPDNILFSGTQTHVFEKTLTSVAGSNTGRLYIPFNGTRTGVILIDSIKIEKTGVQGFVTKLYDQSNNNNHAEQTTAANQPKIVEGGDVCTLNGKPTMRFDGTNDHLTTGKFPALTHPNALCCVVRPTAEDALRYICDAGIDGTATGQRQILAVWNDEKVQQFGGAWVNETAALSNTAASLLWANYDSGNSTMDLNGTIDSSGASPAGGALDSLGIGARMNNTSNLEGDISEFLIWDSNQESVKAGIKANINSHYNIY